jgi:hypothetical protein
MNHYIFSDSDSVPIKLEITNTQVTVSIKNRNEECMSRLSLSTFKESIIQVLKRIERMEKQNGIEKR